MANEKISQLPTVSSSQLTDLLPAVQSGSTVQETLQQVFNLMLGNIILNYAGNPNSHVAGSTYQLLWDTTDKFLWVCTTSGTTLSAVWVPITGTMTNGQLIIGSTGNAPAISTITAGPGISIANGSGSITISGTASSIGWNVVTSTGNMISENGYIANSASSITLTLPTTAAVGSALAIINLNTGGFTIAQNASQNVRVGNYVTTTGTGGSISSNAQGDSIYLVCAVANTTWITVGGVQGNLTLV